MSSSSNNNRAVIAIIVVLLLAAAFWLLILSPKRKEVSELGKEVEQQQTALVEAQGRAAEALAAKAEFPKDYRQLIVLGKAVPEGDETASLIVQLNRIAEHAGVSFDSLALQGGSEGTEATATTAPEAGPTSDPTPIPPTEAEAALLPLGATVGSADLGVMPYALNFKGSFFQIADFIDGIDRLIRTGNTSLGVDGRLVTLDAFSLAKTADGGLSELNAEFAVTAYIVPPSQAGSTGATSVTPEAIEAAPAPEATGTPSSFTTGEAR